ncbi:related to peroxiredoxin q [Ustilago bromivora]|uniref:thioredoxin-dependent peroxiredoxin n=1 Tax=Ustilago bromivora TaxID=307758 RepID=A0A1K0G5J8_9BASI|nr:related to peroxiredoxin q [Ustilago bromivora]SYW79439.1 related to peroxiredoxin q [Ustilago bromivora]
MPRLPRVGAFPIAGERSMLTAAGSALKIPAKERASPLINHLAPEIIAKDHLGRTVSLHSTIALGRPIVLYFFPLAGSPHCTKQSCSFRDALGTSPVFNELNAVVIGISQDPPSRSKRFVDEHDLRFRILHDENRQIMNTWGVGRGLFGLIDGRCTFIIDHHGLVRAMFDGVWDYQGHRQFAEKWLCRIEHDLSARERFYLPHQAEQAAACDGISRNVKVLYGDVVPSRGIAAAPRFGAALSADKVKKTSSKKLPPPASGGKDAGALSIAAEAKANGFIRSHKSKKTLKAWLRPSPSSTGVYDEPLHFDYKLANRSFDDVPRTRRISPNPAARSTDKVAARVRSMRFDNLTTEQQANASEYADRSPRSRQESGSGSDWATPSTISARPISTGETSHTSPGPDSRDSGHAATLAAALKNANKSELQRSSATRRRIASQGGVAVATVIPSARSSSLLNKVSLENASQASKEQDSITLYANGNIARMPLRPAVNGGETSADSMLTVLDRRNGEGGQRSNEVSNDSKYASSTSSLPVPPRPTTRNGGAGGAVAAAASARLQKQSRFPPHPSSTCPDHDDDRKEEEEGYATDRATTTSTTNPGLGIGRVTPDKHQNATFGRTSCSSSPNPNCRTTTKHRNLPQQSRVPSYAPPPLPTSNCTFTRSLSGATNGHPSPSASSASTNPHDSPTAGGMVGENGERRSTSTPSPAPSAMPTFNDGMSIAGASEYCDSSPSIAESTHAFGGLEE